MKHLDTLRSASSNLPAEVGVTEFSAVVADNPGLSQALALGVGKPSPYIGESIAKEANRGNPGAAQKPSDSTSIYRCAFALGYTKYRYVGARLRAISHVFKISFLYADDTR